MGSRVFETTGRGALTRRWPPPEAAIRPTSGHPNTCMLFSRPRHPLRDGVWRSSCSPSPGPMERGLPMSNRVLNERGFGMAELIVVVAVIGLLAALAMPTFLTYWQSAGLSAGAAELQSILNRGRQLAISQNGSLCVEVSGTGVRYRTTSCAGTIWTGTGTSGAGLISLSNGLQIQGGPSVIFSNAGGASGNVNFTVRDPRTSRTRTVAVLTTGR